MLPRRVCALSPLLAERRRLESCPPGTGKPAKALVRAEIQVPETGTLPSVVPRLCWPRSGIKPPRTRGAGSLGQDLKPARRTLPASPPGFMRAKAANLLVRSRLIAGNETAHIVGLSGFVTPDSTKGLTNPHRRDHGAATGPVLAARRRYPLSSPPTAPTTCRPSGRGPWSRTARCAGHRCPWRRSAWPGPPRRRRRGCSRPACRPGTRPCRCRRG